VGVGSSSPQDVRGAGRARRCRGRTPPAPRRGTPGALQARAPVSVRSLESYRPANTGCCSQRGRALWSRIIFCAAALQQNPVSLGFKQRIVFSEAYLRSERWCRSGGVLGLFALVNTACARGSCSDDVPSRVAVTRLRGDSLQISGHIRDRQTHLPVSSATMAWTPVDGSPAVGAFSNDSGAVSVKLQTSGRYVVRIRGLGFSSISTEVTLRPGDGMRIDVALGKLGPGIHPTRCACEASKVCF
jgi:hypothetical protein